MARDITAVVPASEDLGTHNPNSRHQFWSRWHFEVRVDGKPAHDPRFQEVVRTEVARFMRARFGTAAQMRMTVFVEAGDLQNGEPPEQLLMLPSLAVTTKLHGLK